MSWSYSGDPSFSSKDEIRFLVGDTVTTAQMITDEEITYALTLHPKVSGKANYAAASLIAQSIAGSFASQRSKTVGSLSISYGEQNQKYQSMADKYGMLASKGIDGKGPNRTAAPLLFGGGDTYLGPNDERNESYSN